MVLSSVLFILSLNITALFSLEVRCLYSEVNLCKNCSTSYQANNISSMPTSNDNLLIQFCSASIQLDDIIEIESVSNITVSGLSQIHDVLVNCSRIKEAGLAVRNVTSIHIEHLSLVGCGLNNYQNTFNNTTSLKSSIMIVNSCNVAVSDLSLHHGSGAGLSLINTTGTVNIYSVVFANNHMPPNNAQNSESRGGLYIEITSHCVSNREHSMDICSAYSITNCSFKSNNASSNHDHHDFVDQDSSNQGRGGGLSLEQLQETKLS